MRKLLLGAACAAALLISVGTAPAGAQGWTLEQAAPPLKGAQVNVTFLDRPGYRAIIKLLPEFERRTGIKVNYEIVPYENSREKQVLNFTRAATSRWR